MMSDTESTTRQQGNQALSRYCPSCDYDLHGLAAGTCPECGQAFDPARLAPSYGPRMRYRPWLHRFACLLVVATFILVTSGGNVTSRDAGLAVPDGFTVYGHFLWSFPYSEWVGNIFHEHIHRLKGSAIGILSIILCAWLWTLYFKQRQRLWLAWFGTAVLALVIIQGIMGGLRVEFANWAPDWQTPFRILHGVTGQLFLCMTVIAAAAVSRLWMQSGVLQAERTAAAGPTATQPRATGRTARVFSLIVLAVLLVQLVLGAWMRHTDSGLAIPDFPASYGGVMPPMSQERLDAALFDRGDWTSEFTVAQVHVHFAHRVWAVAVVVAIVLFLTMLMRTYGRYKALTRPALGMVVLLIVQVLLGASVIWSGKHHDVATAHQAVGALILALATLLAVRIRLLEPQWIDASEAEQSAGRRASGPFAGGGQLKGAGA